MCICISTYRAEAVGERVRPVHTVIYDMDSARTVDVPVAVTVADGLRQSGLQVEDVLQRVLLHTIAVTVVLV